MLVLGAKPSDAPPLPLWVIPEPTSKAIAAAMTIVLVGYVGVHTLYTLGSGFEDLIENSDKAMTFEALKDAGEKLAGVMGADNARILVMVATAAVGSGLGEFLEVLPKLPGAPQASELAVAEGGVSFEQAGAVEGVTIGRGGLTISLTNGAVLATSLSGNFSGGPRIHVARPAHGAEAGSPPVAETYKNVEIVDSRGAPVGEFDEIRDGRFFEDKSAEGLAKVNPRTGAPQLTADQWAETQIYEKTVTRIENLAHKAAATRAAPGSTAPTLQEIMGIRRVTFRVRSTSPEVVSAISRQLVRLTTRLPGWTFDAIYGVP